MVYFTLLKPQIHPKASLLSDFVLRKIDRCDFLAFF